MSLKIAPRRCADYGCKLAVAALSLACTCLLPDVRANAACPIPPEFTVTWSHTYSETDSIDVASDIAVDNAGNIFVAGSVRMQDRDADFVLLKYGPQGSLLWDRRYDAAGNDDFAAALALDPAGFVYVTGYSTQTGPPAQVVDRTTLKYDTAGNLTWARSFAPVGIRAEQDIAFADNVAVVAFDSTVVKYDSSGNVLWTRSRAGMGAVSVGLDDSLNIYVAGIAPGNYNDFFVIKYSPQGDVRWWRQLDGLANEMVTAAATSSAGDVLVVGKSYNFGMVEPGLYTRLTRNGGVVGGLAWFTDPDYINNNSPNSDVFGAAFDAQGNGYIAGRTLDLYHGRGLILKVDPAGTITQRYGNGTRGDGFTHVALDPQGSVFGAGFTGNDCNRFGVLVKWSSTGEFRGKVAFSTSPDPLGAYVSPVGLHIDNSGAMFVAASDFDWSPVCNGNWYPSSSIRTMRFDPAPPPTPPAFAFGLFQNPYLTEQLRIVVRPSLCVETITLTVNGEDTPLYNQVDWYGDRNIPEGGPLHLKACGTAGGAQGCSELDLFANMLVGGMEGNIRSADGLLLMHVTPQSSSNRVLVLVVNHTTEPASGDPVLAEWEIDPAQVLDDKPSRIEFSFAGLDVSPGRLYFEHGDTGHISSYVDEAGARIVAESPLHGLLRVRLSDTDRSPRLNPNFFFVGQCAPNPFNPGTQIPLETRAPGRVVANVYDVSGRKVASLMNERVGPGEHFLRWNGRNLNGEAVGSGVYFCRVVFGTRVETRKLVLVR